MHELMDRKHGYSKITVKLTPVLPCSRVFPRSSRLILKRNENESLNAVLSDKRALHQYVGQARCCTGSVHRLATPSLFAERAYS